MTFYVVFIGYADNSAAYRFMSLSDRSLSESRESEFFENVFPLKKDSVPHGDSSTVHSASIPDSLQVPTTSSGQGVVVPSRRSKRRRTETSFGPNFITSFLTELNDFDELDELSVCCLLIDDEPKTFEEAMGSFDASFQKEAVNSEIESTMSNHTWELVDLPKGVVKPLIVNGYLKRNVELMAQLKGIKQDY